MLKWLAAIMILLCISTATAYQVTFVIKGYSGKVELNATSPNFSYKGEIANGSVVNLPNGTYSLKIYAMNKTFEKIVNVSRNMTVTFNLAFTNSTANLSTFYHVLVYPTSKGFGVEEVIIITNNGTKNYEGNFTVPLPDYTSFSIDTSSLSFMGYDLSKNSVTFRDLIVPANSTGQIAVIYNLKSNVFELKLKRPTRLMLLTSARVLAAHGLEYMGAKNFGGTTFQVYEGYSRYYMAEFGENVRVFISSPAIAGIILVAGSIFLYFHEKSGGWKF